MRGRIIYLLPIAEGGATARAPVLLSLSRSYVACVCTQ